MKVSALFRQLSFGELSNLSISNSGSGTILEAKYPQLISYVNDALTALHSRFVLKEQAVIVEQMTGITDYELTSKHSETTGNPAGDNPLYIKDTVGTPFSDDVIRILEVWDADRTYVLNDNDADYSVFTPSPLVLRVLEPIDGEQLTIAYQADHAPLLDTFTDPDTAEIILEQDIEIPHYLNTAIQKFVASEVFSHMNGQENILKSQEYLAAYESACLVIEQRDQANQFRHDHNTKLERRGFV